MTALGPSASVAIPRQRRDIEHPGQMDVAVLTIALDAGFQSFASFNRAFRADTWRTPTKFRRMALAGRKAGDAEARIEPSN